MRKRITTMAGAGLIALAFMTGCQGVEPPDPGTGGGGALLSKGPEAAKADSNWTLNDPCFPGRGTALPASCNVDTPVKTDPGSGDVSVKTDPVIVVTPIEIEPADPTKVGDGKMEWSLNDPCFPGRGTPLPESCNAGTPIGSDPVDAGKSVADAGKTGDGTADKEWTLDDPCFPGRSYLPPECSAL